MEGKQKVKTKNVIFSQINEKTYHASGMELILASSTSKVWK